MGQLYGLGTQLPQGFSIRADGLARIFQIFLNSLRVVWVEIKASEAGLNKRIDELQEDQKETRRKVDHLPLKIMEMLRKAPH